MGNLAVGLARRLNNELDKPIDTELVVLRSEIARAKELGASLAMQETNFGDLIARVVLRADDHSWEDRHGKS